VHFAREMAGAKLGLFVPEQAEQTRVLELAAYRSCDAVVVASGEDGEILAQEGNMPPQFMLPIIIPIRERAANASSAYPELLFVGGFRHAPNLDGLQWFMREVWPVVFKAVPDVRITVIGSNPPAELQSFAGLPGVTLLGYVPNTEPYLDRAHLSVAPLRYGAGMKGKVVEAMASALPVVTTSFGAQGLHATSGEHLVIADKPEEFADGVIRLLQDPVQAERIGLAGQRHAETICGPEAAYKTIQTMLSTVVGAGRPGVAPAGWWVNSLCHHATAAARISVHRLRSAR
jgi:glycosyltransferase involved in cell wall biosynthesis